MSLVGSENLLGIEEAIMNCNYYITSLKCISISGTLLKIPKEHLFEKVKNFRALVQTAKQQMELLN
jgi:hypothetical protein